MSEGILNLMEYLTVDDVLTSLNKRAVKFIEKMSELMSVVSIMDVRYSLNYIESLSKSKNAPVKPFTSDMLLDHTKSDIYNNPKECFESDLQTVFEITDLQHVIEECYRTIYSIILAELDDSPNSSLILIIEMLHKILKALRIFDHCPYIDTVAIFFHLEAFLNKLLNNYSDFEAFSFNQKCKKQCILLEMVLLHRICPKIHGLVYLEISFEIQKIITHTEENKKLSLTNTELLQGYLVILDYYTAAALQKWQKFDEITCINLKQIEADLDKIKRFLPDYILAPVENVRYYIRRLLE